jgi:hypothetical protein
MDHARNRRRTAARRLLGAVLALALGALLGPRADGEGESGAFLRAHKPLVLAARRYFDLSTDYGDGLRALRPELERLAEAGDRVLEDPERLRWMVAQGRTFTAPFTDRSRRVEFTDLRVGRHGRIRSFRSQELNVAFATPRGYPDPKKLARYPRPDPYPLIVSLHEPEDGRGRVPSGVEALRRRYPYADHAGLYDRWLMLAPMAGRGRYVGQGGLVRNEILLAPLRAFWRAYHVDFRRIVLDGAQAALDAAATMPWLFAGIVLRGGALETEAQQAAVRNFAPVPVYVVDDRALARRLRDLGHPNVTLGDGAHLPPWIERQERRLPARYAWDASAPDKHGSYWINVDVVEAGAARHRFEAEVLDTPSNPNTISIRTTGIRELSLFLDDTLVDLDRPVRVVIDDRLMYRDTLSVPVLGRDLKSLFHRRPIETRKSMYFGWLRPGWIERLAVPKAPPK